MMHACESVPSCLQVPCAKHASCHAGSADQTVKLWALSGQPSAGEEAAAVTANVPAMQIVKSFRTRTMPIFDLCWTHRNLLLASGAMAPLVQHQAPHTS